MNATLSQLDRTSAKAEILKTIKEETGNGQKLVSLKTIRAKNAGKNFEELGKALDILLRDGQIYEGAPSQFGAI